MEGLLEHTMAVYFGDIIMDPILAYIKQYYIENNFVVKNYYNDPVIFNKFSIWFDTDISDIATFKQQISDFDYIIRGPNFGEIVPKGYSKASGIEFLCDYFNIPLDNCYVFGDSSNDESMLSYVKHAIVMGNGEPHLFKHAYYVTKHINNDGIQNALQHLQLI